MESTETKEFTIQFGAMAPEVSKQILEQTGLVIIRFDGTANSIVKLHLLDVLIYSEVRKARKRLFKLINKAVKSELKAKKADKKKKIIYLADIAKDELN